MWLLLLPILMLYQFVDGAQIVLANALRGLSDVKSIMWISLVTNFLIAIPAGYLLGFPFGMGIRGIWLAYPIGFGWLVVLFTFAGRDTERSTGVLLREVGFEVGGCIDQSSKLRHIGFG